MSNLRELASSQPDSFSMKVFVEQPNLAQEPEQHPLSVGRISRKDIEDALVSRGLLNRISVPNVAWWRRPLSLIWAQPGLAVRKRDTEPVEHGKNVLFLVCGPEPYVTRILASVSLQYQSR